MTQVRIKIDPKIDYYSVLDVSSTADEAAIKKAYRILARQHHPDVSKSPDAEEKFKAINEAYVIVSDPQRRRTYDGLRKNPQRYGIDDKGFYEEDIEINDLFNGIFDGLKSQLQQITTVAGLRVARNGHPGLDLMERLFLESLGDVKIMVRFYGVGEMYEPKIRILEGGWNAYKGMQARYAPQQAQRGGKTKRTLDWLLGAMRPHKK